LPGLAGEFGKLKLGATVGIKRSVRHAIRAVRLNGIDANEEHG
jgi:hypothetical protein